MHHLVKYNGGRRRVETELYTPVRYLLILEFKSMKLNFILLPQLLCAIHKVSGSLHLSKTMA